MATKTLKIMVPAGGPDRERPISLQSGDTIAHALSASGHEVYICDPQPGRTDYIETFLDWPGDVVFPALHGAWGEGGPLQEILEAHNLPFVGCGSKAAGLCIDKNAAKLAAQKAGIPTASFELVTKSGTPSLEPPVVVKAPREGSSIDLAICKTKDDLDRVRADFHQRHDALMIEQFIDGIELTVGMIHTIEDDDVRPLPPIQIVSSTAFYDYEAKYERDDTQYRFDIDLEPSLIDRIKDYAIATFKTLGCRDLARIDFMVDRNMNPYLLEVNTLPGFTSHSLVPMAAAHAGIELPTLVDRLARTAFERGA